MYLISTFETNLEGFIEEFAENPDAVNYIVEVDDHNFSNSEIRKKLLRNRLTDKGLDSQGDNFKMCSYFLDFFRI